MDHRSCYPGVVVHPSHLKVLDVSDLTLYHDLMCDACLRTDEKLSEPCK